MNKSTAFSDMLLSEGMLQTLKSVGFEAATPIQQKSIPELLQGKDLLGQAQTGTGKTAAFAVPVIETVDQQRKEIQALIVCPTRELCLQVCEEFKRLSAHTSGIEVAALYGGQAIDQQFKTLKTRKPQIIVATPGRLFDHLRRKSINLSTVSMIVLDEADEMLDMGFRDEIEQIFDLLPDENQRIFFSATMPKAIMDLVHNYLREPIIIRVESKNLTVAKIAQSYFRVRGKEKTELLCRVLDHRDPKLAVVFCNAKSTADEIVDQIKYRGFEAGVLHGDLSQNQRDRVMAKFKAGQIRVLVATDIAARGLDIDDVELVLNYHLPHDPEDYVHRIGRTGRAGREGRAISLVEPRDNSRLRKITQFARTEIIEEEPPTLNEVRAAKMSSLFGKVKDALTSEMIPQYRSFLSKQSLSSEDVAAGLIKIALEKFDENVNDDAFADQMPGKRYSGFSSERRRDSKEGRGSAGGGGGNFGRNRQGRDYEPGNGYRDRGPRPQQRFGESRFGSPKPRESSHAEARSFGGPKEDRPQFARSAKRFGDGAPAAPRAFQDSRGPKRNERSGERSNERSFAPARGPKDAKRPFNRDGAGAEARSFGGPKKPADFSRGPSRGKPPYEREGPFVKRSEFSKKSGGGFSKPGPKGPRGSAPGSKKS